MHYPVDWSPNILSPRRWWNMSRILLEGSRLIGNVVLDYDVEDVKVMLPSCGSGDGGDSLDSNSSLQVIYSEQMALTSRERIQRSRWNLEIKYASSLGAVCCWHWGGD